MNAFVLLAVLTVVLPTQVIYFLYLLNAFVLDVKLRRGKYTEPSLPVLPIPFVRWMALLFVLRQMLFFLEIAKSVFLALVFLVEFLVVFVVRNSLVCFYFVVVMSFNLQ